MYYGSTFSLSKKVNANLRHNYRTARGNVGNVKTARRSEEQWCALRLGRRACPRSLARMFSLENSEAWITWKITRGAKCPGQTCSKEERGQALLPDLRDRQLAPVPLRSLLPQFLLASVLENKEPLRFIQHLFHPAHVAPDVEAVHQSVMHFH